MTICSADGIMRMFRPIFCTVFALVAHTDHRFGRAKALFFTLTAISITLAHSTATASIQDGQKIKRGGASHKSSGKSSDKHDERSSGKVSAERQKLERLRKQIDADREKLNLVRKRESKMNETLDKQRRKRAQLETSIGIFDRRVRRAQDSIQKTGASITVLEQRLRSLQREYAKLARRSLKQSYRAAPDWAIMEGESQSNEIASYCIRLVTAAARERAGETARLLDSLSGQKSALAAALMRNAEMKASEENRKKRVEQHIELSAKTLDSIRADKKLLQRELEKKNASVAKLQAFITQLIAEAERLAKAEARRSKKRDESGADKTDANTAKSRSNSPKDDAEELAKQSAAANRIIAGAFKPHSLPWPVEGRKILHKFGAYTNPATKTVMNNPGVNIAAEHGSAVRAVAKGRVSLVSWLPGYGSLVIIDHGNDFRTVYANLASVTVNEGDAVSAESVVGKSGRSVEGEYAHFEIWHERAKLNPGVWLK